MANDSYLPYSTFFFEGVLYKLIDEKFLAEYRIAPKYYRSAGVTLMRSVSLLLSGLFKLLITSLGPGIQ